MYKKHMNNQIYRGRRKKDGCQGPSWGFGWIWRVYCSVRVFCSGDGHFWKQIGIAIIAQHCHKHV